MNLRTHKKTQINLLKRDEFIEMNGRNNLNDMWKRKKYVE